MWNFFRTFFAALLALVVFTVLVFFFFAGFLGGLASKSAVRVSVNSVLVLDPSQHFGEQKKSNPLGVLSAAQQDTPGLYDVLRLISRAASDNKIQGIYLVANSNANSFSSSEEIRSALLAFKKSGKFVIAHADVLTQAAYSIANVADKIYVSPQGFVEWSGYSLDYLFLKGALDKLEIQPQIFYAGKFKSATEPLRATEMTPENRLQTSVWLNDLYADLLVKTSETRKVDTATLHRLANEASIQTPADAVTHKLIDAVKYDDEVKDEIKQKLGIDKYKKINFVSLGDYAGPMPFPHVGNDRIALIYAEGDIIDGKSGADAIGSDTYRNLIRKARLDRNIRAIVFRINSGGGSSMASENIWRELALARKEKPVIVSFGDVAASGGYYIAVAADSIFALPTTITGSIGVFGIIPNMESFFKNKLGVTFDGVKTADYAGSGTITRPMNEKEKTLIQAQINLIYTQFKERVAEGRKLDTAFVDSIAQGRVWTGYRAKEIGLIDRFGGIQDAIRSAAAMAKLTDYSVFEYPEPRGMFEELLGAKDPIGYEGRIKEEMGAENYKVYTELKRINQMTGTIQARMPFQFVVR
ncbi:MAG: signal peptide peptidase SppA [Chitinophagaceae bacterium]|nr:MAG: signal peptide peptidase SppA [Chitinophagaceae bacterium]